MNLEDHPRPIKVLQWTIRGKVHVSTIYHNIKYENLAELLLYNLEGIIYLLRLTSYELIKVNEPDYDTTTISGIVEKM